MRGPNYFVLFLKPLAWMCIQALRSGFIEQKLAVLLYSDRKLYTVCLGYK
jgi:hypothetical protein